MNLFSFTYFYFILFLEKFQTGNEEQIFTSFIRLGTVEDVRTNNNNNNQNNNTNNNTKNSNNNIFTKNIGKERNCKKKTGGLGVEVVSVGDVIRMDRLLDLAFKYHRKVAPKLLQFKFRNGYKTETCIM